GRGGRRLRDRHGLEGGALLPDLHRRAAVPPGRPVRPARRREPGRMTVLRHLPALLLFGAAALAPSFVRDNYLLDTLVLVLLWGALAGAWNVAGGYAGQVSLGHAAFFGIGTYAAALGAIHWGASAWLAMLVGGVVSTGAGLIIGYLSNR